MNSRPPVCKTSALPRLSYDPLPDSTASTTSGLVEAPRLCYIPPFTTTRVEWPDSVPGHCIEKRSLPRVRRDHSLYVTRLRRVPSSACPTLGYRGPVLCYRGRPDVPLPLNSRRAGYYEKTPRGSLREGFCILVDTWQVLTLLEPLPESDSPDTAGHKNVVPWRRRSRRGYAQISSATAPRVERSAITRPRSFDRARAWTAIGVPAALIWCSCVS